MKRIVTLLLAAGLVFGAYTGAQAADVKVSGQWAFGFNFTDNNDFVEDNSDNFGVTQRLRTQIDIIASENLKGVVYFEIGNQGWGNQEQGGALEADGVVVEVKRSYIDWTVPNTELMIRMGIQGLALPGAAFGSPIFDEDVAALTMSYAFNDTFALTAFWARPFDGDSAGDTAGTTTDPSPNDEMDIFGLIAPITLDGHAITPYFVYSSIGKDSAFIRSTDDGGLGMNGLTENVDAYWFGVAYSMTAFDPFTLDMDFIYGSADGADNAVDQDGWMIDFKAAYALDFMTPALLGWYASGDDDDDQGIMPVVANAGSWAPTSFGFPGSCFAIDTAYGEDPFGTWGLGFALEDISFVEDLTHVVRFVYMQGTNDDDRARKSVVRATNNEFYLTEDDSAIEINLDTEYKIYENLSLVVELGYISLDMDNDTLEEDAYKATFNFLYAF